MLKPQNKSPNFLIRAFVCPPYRKIVICIKIHRMKKEEQSFEERVKAIIEKSNRPAEEVILDDLDIQTLLKVSRRTSLNYRKSGVLPFHQINKGKIFYILSEVITAIKSAGNNNQNFKP
jgi:hypothetical protein